MTDITNKIEEIKYGKEISKEYFLNLDYTELKNVDKIFNYLEYYLGRNVHIEYKTSISEYRGLFQKIIFMTEYFASLNSANNVEEIFDNLQKCSSEYFKAKANYDEFYERTTPVFFFNRDGVDKDKLHSLRNEILLYEQEYITDKSNLNKILHEYYGRIQNSEPNQLFISMNGLFNPQISNKKKAQILINETINLIQNDEYLNIKAKERLIKMLNDILNELNSPNTNWNMFFGKIRQLITVFGALGAMTGGTCSAIMVKMKLEEANKIIEDTSINMNHKILRETFDIEKIKELKNTPNNLLIEDDC